MTYIPMPTFWVIFVYYHLAETNFVDENFSGDFPFLMQNEILVIFLYVYLAEENFVFGGN